jgi:hypothetical protein
MTDNSSIWPPHEVFYIESMLTITRTAVSNLAQLQFCLDEHSSHRPVNDDQILDLVQNLISNAGALSRYFWPSSKKTIHVERANALQLTFGISDDNPLKDRKIRNFIEHFDENLDNFLGKLIAGTIIPSYVGYQSGSDELKPNFFRAYYLDKAVFCVLDNEYSIVPIIKEVTELHQQLLKLQNEGGRLPDIND